MRKQYVTCLPTIVTCVLKELRLEDGLHQTRMADLCNKSASAWAKIELGKTALSMGDFFKACDVLGVESFEVLEVVEDYADYLYKNDWDICEGSLDEGDDLLVMMGDFYGSDAFKKRLSRRRFSIMETRLGRRTNKIVDVMRFAAESDFREVVINTPEDISNRRDADYR